MSKQLIVAKVQKMSKDKQKMSKEKKSPKNSATQSWKPSMFRSKIKKFREVFSPPAPGGGEVNRRLKLVFGFKNLAAPILACF